MCVPGGVAAKPVGTFDFVVAEPGDQTRPSIDGQFVVYSGPGADGALDVLLYDTQLRTTKVIAGAAGDPPGDYVQPDVSFSTAIYRAPEGIRIEFWQTDAPIRRPPPGGDGPVSAPVIGSRVAAWEAGPPGARDVRVRRSGDGREAAIPSASGGAPVGDQHAPAAFGDLVAYVDGADHGAVRLYDAIAGTSSLVCGGSATGVSVGSDGADTWVAVARSTSEHDEDVEVWAPGAPDAPVAALRVPGPQRNPHLTGAWVAFEDVSTQRSQVVVWNWKTGLVFVPHPSTTNQVLNDLTLLSGEEVRVVFEDSLSDATGRDIALYVLDLAPLTDDGQPNGYPFDPPAEEPARCDGTRAPLATLRLGRDRGAPLAGEVAFDAPAPAGASRLPVLVCIDAERVSSAWVTLDDEAVARPSDFEPSVVHREALGEVVGGAGRISGVIAGKPGASLVVRVIADPARLAEAPPAKDAGGAAAGAGLGDAGLGGGGCAAAPGGPLALAALALVLARRRAGRG